MHREHYYELLQEVRLTGDWEKWLVFFLEGVHSTAEQAAQTARQILRLFEEDRALLRVGGKTAGSVHALHHWLQEHPIFTIAQAARALHLSTPTVTAALKQLAEKGIVEPMGSARRNRVFSYARYLAILSEGTEPLPPRGATAQ